MGKKTPIGIFAFLFVLGVQSGGANAEEVTRPPAFAAAAASLTRIDAVRFTGAVSIAPATLTATIAPWLHRDLSFDQMHEMAGAVTGLYRQRGYMVASAYLPAQKIHDRTLTIGVIEGTLGAVRLRSNGTRIADDELIEALNLQLCGHADCQGSGPIRSARVERAALLLSEIPGVKAKYELTPGQAPGSTDLLLDANAAKWLSVVVGADNNGFAATGRNRGSLAVSAANLLGRGDLFSLSATYTGKGFFGAAFDGSVPLGLGARGGVTAGHLRYALGREFAVLKATGVSDQVGGYTSYPLVRTLNSRLDIRMDVIAKWIRSDVITLNFRSKAFTREGVITVSGGQRDRLLGQGVSDYRMSYTQGNLELRDAASLAFDATTASSDGAFGKFNYMYRREQLLAPGWTLFAQASGQYATANLDSSEKFPLGGSQGVRAYATGAAAADSATLLTVETRVHAPASLTGRWELVVAPFYDYAFATFNKRLWTGYKGPNRAELAGAGIYASLADPGRYSLRVSYANRQHTPRDVVPGSKDQFWFEAAASF